MMWKFHHGRAITLCVMQYLLSDHVNYFVELIVQYILR